MADNRPYYDIQFLDDIHNYFPDILYRPERFLTVASLLQYIRTQASARYDLFSNAQRNAQRNHVVNTTPINERFAAHIHTINRRPASHSPSPSPSPPPLNRTRQAAYEVIPLNTLLNTLLGLSQIGQGQGHDLNFMDAVQVAPSAQQVERSTQLRQANAQDETASCSICQDSFTSGQAIRFLRHCRHEFHRGCIDTWFQSNVHCPMCRWDIREDEEGEIHE